jgi:hypothetical protein
MNQRLDDYPEANMRHDKFMPEGLKEIQASLQIKKVDARADRE